MEVATERLVLDRKSFQSILRYKRCTSANVEVEMPEEKNYFKKIAAPKVAEAVAANDMKAAWMTELADLNVCSQKGLVEMFRFHRCEQRLHAIRWKIPATETQSMVAKLPVAKGDCDTVTMNGFEIPRIIPP